MAAWIWHLSVSVNGSGEQDDGSPPQRIASKRDSRRGDGSDRAAMARERGDATQRGETAEALFSTAVAPKKLKQLQYKSSENPRKFSPIDGVNRSPPSKLRASVDLEMVSILLGVIAVALLCHR
ncbi:hypothetical protein Scep_003600 [Stephania cephalantha]|uniref:Uncharacterized protein n=1 Tax=Stephania cephalantha TaxID=152367 RepID=A0AAP0KQU4_9MAGN